MWIDYTAGMTADEFRRAAEEHARHCMSVGSSHADYQRAHDDMVMARKLARLMESFPLHTPTTDPVLRAQIDALTAQCAADAARRRMAQYSHLSGYVDEDVIRKLTGDGQRKVDDQTLLTAQLITELSAFRKVFGVQNP